MSQQPRQQLMEYSNDCNTSDDESRTKKSRTTQACLSCRKRRVKCDGMDPCSECQSMAVECEFTVLKKRGPLSQTQQIKDLEMRLDVLQNIVVSSVPGASETLNIPMAIDSSRSNRFVNADLFTLVREGSTSTLRFLGNTTDIDPLHMHQSPRFQGGVFHIPILQDTRTHTLPIALPEVCPKSLHIYLAEVYFKSIHQFYPMLDKTEYFAHLNAPTQSDEFSVLMYGVSAVVAQVIGPLPDWNITHSFPLSLSLIRRAKTLLPNQIDRCSLFTIQACLILTIAGCASIESLNPSMYLSLGVQMCHSLGMHRNLSLRPNTDLIYSEALKRTWYCAMMLDHNVFMCVGRPALIRNDHWDTQMPNWSINQSNHSNVDTVAFDSLILLLKIIGNILEISTGVNKKNRLRLIEIELKNLTGWVSSLPSSLANIIKGSYQSTWGLAHFLGLNYHSALIMVYRFKDEHCPSEHLEQMRLIFTQTPKINLQEGAYIPPHQVYLSILLSNAYISNCHDLQNLVYLKHNLQTLSKLECTYSYAFKGRAFIYELLVSKHLNAVGILGVELSTMLPIGASNVELKEIYQILVGGDGKERVEVDQSGAVRMVHENVYGLEEAAGDAWMNEFEV